MFINHTLCDHQCLLRVAWDQQNISMRVRDYFLPWFFGFPIKFLFQRNRPDPHYYPYLAMREFLWVDPHLKWLALHVPNLDDSIDVVKLVCCHYFCLNIEVLVLGFRKRQLCLEVEDLEFEEVVVRPRSQCLDDRNLSVWEEAILVVRACDRLIRELISVFRFFVALSEVDGLFLDRMRVAPEDNPGRPLPHVAVELLLILVHRNVDAVHS